MKRNHGTLVMMLGLFGCSGGPERIDEYARAPEHTAHPAPPPAPTPTPTVTASVAPPPQPSEALLAVPKCAPAFLNSVRGPVDDPKAEAACTAIKRSFFDAKDAIAKGCDGGDPAMCTLLGSMQGSVDWFGAELVVFVPPCHPHDRCWARYANSGTSNFAGASPDDAKAVAALDKGCSLGGPAACEALGVALFGRGDAHASEIAKKACDLGRGVDCRTLVERALKNKETLDPQTVKTVLKNEAASCDRGVGESCLTVATLAELGWASEIEAGAPREKFEKACSAHIGIACAKLVFGQVAGTWTSSQGELQAAERELEKSCSPERALVCAAMGLAIQKGIGVAQDSDRGQRILNEACNHRTVDCSELPQ